MEEEVHSVADTYIISLSLSLLDRFQLSVPLSEARVSHGPDLKRGKHRVVREERGGRAEGERRDERGESNTDKMTIQFSPCFSDQEI